MPGNERFVGEEIVTITIPVSTLKAACDALEDCISQFNERGRDKKMIRNGSMNRGIADEYGRHLKILKRSASRK